MEKENRKPAGETYKHKGKGGTKEMTIVSQERSQF